MERTSTVYTEVRVHDPINISVGGRRLWCVVESMHRAESGKFGYDEYVESNVCDLCSLECGGKRHADEGMIMFVMREVVGERDKTPRPGGLYLQISSMCAIEMALGQIIDGVAQKVERHANN